MTGDQDASGSRGFRLFKCCSYDRNFRVKHYTLITNLFLTFGYALQFLSNLDCFYIKVDVGFKASNVVYDSPTFGLGLWTFEDPNDSGFCASSLEKKNISDVTYTYAFYSSFWSNSDAAWTASRIMALMGICFGIVAMVSAWTCSCIAKSKSRRIVRLILYSTIFALTCEGSKLGLFFTSKPCTASEWELIDIDEVSTFHDAATCSFGRGSLMSLSSLILYIIVITYLVVVVRFPHQEDRTPQEEINLDDVTMPSYLNGIGRRFAQIFSINMRRGRKQDRPEKITITRKRSDRNKRNDSENNIDSKPEEKRDVESIPLVISSKKRKTETRPQAMESINEDTRSTEIYKNESHVSSGIASLISSENSEVYSINSQSYVSSMGGSTLQSSMRGMSKKSMDDTTVGGSIDTGRASLTSQERRKARRKKLAKEMAQLCQISHCSTKSGLGGDSTTDGKSINSKRNRTKRFKMTKEMSQISIFSYISGFSSIGLHSARSGMSKLKIPREDEEDRMYA